MSKLNVTYAVAFRTGPLVVLGAAVVIVVAGASVVVEVGLDVGPGVVVVVGAAVVVGNAKAVMFTLTMTSIRLNPDVSVTATVN